MLFFKSSLVFYKTIEKLDSMNNTEIEQWLVENKFHNSLYFKMKELEECGDNIDDGFSLAPGDFKDKSFATLLNSNGLISIGDTISYLTKYNEYVITDGDISLVDVLNENPDLQSANIIKHQHKQPNLKSSSGYWRTIPYPYDENPELEIRIERWLHIYFWVHSSTVQVELVHKSNNSKREPMAYCELSASGEFCCTDKDGNCGWEPHSTSGSEYNITKNERRIFRKTWKSGDLCAKSITIYGSVRKKGNYSTGDGGIFPLVNYSVTLGNPTGSCINF